jgi:hypothetical protein
MAAFLSLFRVVEIFGYLAGDPKLDAQIGCDCMKFTASSGRSQWRALRIPAN